MILVGFTCAASFSVILNEGAFTASADPTPIVNSRPLLHKIRPLLRPGFGLRPRPRPKPWPKPAPNKKTLKKPPVGSGKQPGSPGSPKSPGIRGTPKVPGTAKSPETPAALSSSASTKTPGSPASPSAPASLGYPGSTLSAGYAGSAAYPDYYGSTGLNMQSNPSYAAQRLGQAAGTIHMVASLAAARRGAAQLPPPSPLQYDDYPVDYQDARTTNGTVDQASQKTSV
uniref:Uncharacterized protein n=1 Tax=Rhipicephalus zambeziensis TaxID=60191 RepID=A0A224YK32_9ACAR